MTLQNKHKVKQRRLLSLLAAVSLTLWGDAGPLRAESGPSSDRWWAPVFRALQQDDFEAARRGIETAPPQGQETSQVLSAFKNVLDVLQKDPAGALRNVSLASQLVAAVHVLPKERDFFYLAQMGIWLCVQMECYEAGAVLAGFYIDHYVHAKGDPILVSEGATVAYQWMQWAREAFRRQDMEIACQYGEKAATLALLLKNRPLMRKALGFSLHLSTVRARQQFEKGDYEDGFCTLKASLEKHQEAPFEGQEGRLMAEVASRGWHKAQEDGALLPLDVLEQALHYLEVMSPLGKHYAGLAALEGAGKRAREDMTTAERAKVFLQVSVPYILEKLAENAEKKGDFEAAKLLRKRAEEHTTG